MAKSDILTDCATLARESSADCMPVLVSFERVKKKNLPTARSAAQVRVCLRRAQREAKALSKRASSNAARRGAKASLMVQGW